MFIWAFLGVASGAVLPEDRWVGNDNLAVGLHEDGSFANPTLELGILWDPDGTSGPMPLSGDMIWVGHKWDVWSWDWLRADGSEESTVHGGPHLSAWTGLDWDERIDNDALVALRGSISTELMTIQSTTVALQRADVVIQDLIYTPNVYLGRLRVGRTVDPDQDHWLLGTYSTNNASGEGWASAESNHDARALAIAGMLQDGTLGAGGVCSWCSTPEAMIGTEGASGSSDTHPNVLIDAGESRADISVHMRFVYAFSVGGEAAAALALDSLWIDDLDDDGLSEDDGDCDDLDPTTHPGAHELLDGIDNDCDGETDEDTLEQDDDGDGFSETEGDCDDDDPDVFPGADPTEGVTNADCDGEADSDETGDDPDDTGAGLDTGGSSDTGSDDGGVINAPEGNEPAEEAGPIVIGQNSKGCNCATSSAPASMPWLFGFLVWARRRRGDQ